MVKTKTRVGVLMRESLKGKTASSNAFPNLVTLSERYDTWCKQVRGLIVALQQHHAVMGQIEKTRANLSKHFAALSVKTPIHEATGMLPSADRPSSTVNSYASIHDTLSAKTQSYVAKYQQFVIDYAVEWEKVVVTRVGNGLKVVQDLRRDLDHYQKKVEAMRLSVNQAMSKGKNVKADTAERLKRNEEKLISAKQTFNKSATDLCILMEEVTERSWRDLHPLLLKCAQFDMTLASDESSILSGLNAVVSALKEVATAQGLSPQPRLKDLAGVKPELLSTRPGGVSGLMIEAGAAMGGELGSGTAFGGYDSMAQPPGSVALQGMGGYPVSITDSMSQPGFPSDHSAPMRSDSIGSFASAPPMSNPSLYNGSNGYNNSGGVDPLSTLGMLTLSGSAAPPPTMEDVYAASRSAPSSGNLPPLGPSYSNYSVRSASYNDMDSMSNYSAPAPMGSPPPPPNMPPPPPPGPAYDAYPPQQAAWSAEPPPAYAYAPAPVAYQQYPPPLPNAYGPPPTAANPFG
jgi:hypothetical protein